MTRTNSTKLVFFILFIFPNITTYAQTTLIPVSDTWKYYDAGNEPTGAWKSVGYNDSSWSIGSAELGYGDGDEDTVINSSINTAYFRNTFNVVNPTPYLNLDINLKRDDGAIVYLNGVEVWRSNMPSGAVNYNTFASSSANAWVFNNIANTLVAGTNVLAVEVHQVSSTSTDITFNLLLQGKTGIDIPRGPYLQQGTSGEMTIRWRTDSPTQSIVNYGTTPTTLSNSASDMTLKTEHSIEITGLAPETVYYYNLANAGGIIRPAETDLYFKTSPTIGTARPTKIWVLGDPGTKNTNQRNVRDAYYNHIGSNHTDMILFLGDNAYNDGTDAEYQAAMFELMYEDMLQKTVSWSTLGNHDGHSANSSTQTGVYYDIFTFPKSAEAGGTASGTESYYSFDYGNIHVIVLNSYDESRAVGSAMYNWCLNDLQNTTADWIIAIWHHPAYSRGSHDSDFETRPIEMRGNFLPILEDYGVDLVLNGHSHSYERSYFLNGHYGVSSTFDTNIHTVGTTGDGDGRIDGDGIYCKTIEGEEEGEGAVYITAGSSGKATGGPLDHNAMFLSLNELGSLCVEVDGQEMNVQFLDDSGNTDDYFTICKDIIVPVELTYFEATPSRKDVKLIWQTVSETHNKGFEIERSTNQKEWRNIAWVKGAGTTSEVKKYEYIDRVPPLGNLYYRLKQIDIDGRFEYSDIEVLSLESDVLKIYPNPSSGEFIIADNNLPIDVINIFDLYGSLIERISPKNNRINLSHLPKGVYFLEVNANQKQHRKKLILE